MSVCKHDNEGDHAGGARSAAERGLEGEAHIDSALVERVTRLVVQELLEGEQTDFLGGRGRYERRSGGRAMTTIRVESGPLEDQWRSALPRVLGGGELFRPAIMSFVDGDSQVLERLVIEMEARGLSTTDVEDAFKGATGESMISRTAVSEITDRIWEDYQACHRP